MVLQGFAAFFGGCDLGKVSHTKQSPEEGGRPMARFKSVENKLPPVEKLTTTWGKVLESLWKVQPASETDKLSRFADIDHFLA
jgi:hypothetical protein